MPIHDGTRVDAGISHDFHHSWIEEINRALNRSLLPPVHYALAEQIAGGLGPDVLTLQRARFEFDWSRQFELSLDPETSRNLHDETRVQGVFKSAKLCSMCGPKFCSVRITQDIHATANRLELGTAEVVK